MDGNKTTSINTRLSKIWVELTEYPHSFMFFIILSMMIPRIYRMTHVFWVGHIDYSSLAIAEQYEFMGIIIEIVNESIPFGVLGLVSQHYMDRDQIVRLV